MSPTPARYPPAFAVPALLWLATSCHPQPPPDSLCSRTGEVHDAVRGAPTVEAILQHRREGIQRCWGDRGVKREPPTIACARMRIRIHRDGSVQDVDANATTSDLERCLERVVADWCFAASANAMTLEVPLRFYAGVRSVHDPRGIGDQCGQIGDR